MDDFFDQLGEVMILDARQLAGVDASGDDVAALALAAWDKASRIVEFHWPSIQGARWRFWSTTMRCRKFPSCATSRSRCDFHVAARFGAKSLDWIVGPISCERATRGGVVAHGASFGRAKLWPRGLPPSRVAAVRRRVEVARERGILSRLVLRAGRPTLAAGREK